MKRGQVFVRAKDPHGRWHSADVLDLDEPSFRAWITEVLVRNHLVTGLRDEHVPGMPLELRSTVDAPVAQRE